LFQRICDLPFDEGSDDKGDKDIQSLPDNQLIADETRNVSRSDDLAHLNDYILLLPLRFPHKNSAGVPVTSGSDTEDLAGKWGRQKPVQGYHRYRRALNEKANSSAGRSWASIFEALRSGFDALQDMLS
jgi:hypothetical protein